MRLVDIADLVGRDVSLRPTTLAVLGLPIRYRVYRDGRVEEFVISNPIAVILAAGRVDLENYREAEASTGLV